MDEKKEILKLFYNDQTIIDDCDRREKELCGVVEFNAHNKGLAALLTFTGDIPNQPLYGIYIGGEDNKLHLSRLSIGGVINRADAEEYNKVRMKDDEKIKQIYFKEETKCYE